MEAGLCILPCCKQTAKPAPADRLTSAASSSTNHLVVAGQPPQAGTFRTALSTDQLEELKHRWKRSRDLSFKGLNPWFKKFLFTHLWKAKRKRSCWAPEISQAGRDAHQCVCAHMALQGPTLRCFLNKAVTSKPFRQPNVTLPISMKLGNNRSPQQLHSTMGLYKSSSRKS